MCWQITADRLLRKQREAQLSEESNGIQLYGVSLICGIGFTMSLFIGSLAFANSAHLIDEVKSTCVMGSVLAALAGIVVLRCVARQIIR